jgi:hypothetical protein
VVEEGLLSNTAQNIVDSLQVRLHGLEIRLHALQADAKRYAFEACVKDSWRARQNFRDTVEAADKLSDEATMVSMALQEAYTRLQARGRDAGDIMKELGLSGANKQ